MHLMVEEVNGRGKGGACREQEGGEWHMDRVGGPTTCIPYICLPAIANFLWGDGACLVTLCTCNRNLFQAIQNCV